MSAKDHEAYIELAGRYAKLAEGKADLERQFAEQREHLGQIRAMLFIVVCPECGSQAPGVTERPRGFEECSHPIHALIEAAVFYPEERSIGRLEKLERLARSARAEGLQRVPMEDYEDEDGVGRAEAWIASDEWVANLHNDLAALNETTPDPDQEG